MNKGRLFVLTGPSGTGKGTICKELCKQKRINLSVSMTTRKPRTNEIDGESYFFVDDEQFLKVLAEDGFLEYAEVYGSMYGTPKEPVLKSLEDGEDVILEIDIRGAMKVKEIFPEGIFVYILPPSINALRERLEKRGTETEEAIQLRLKEVVDELSYIEEYDYYVINSDLREAIESIKAIMKAEHFTVNERTTAAIKKIIENR